MAGVQLIVQTHPYVSVHLVPLVTGVNPVSTTVIHHQHICIVFFVTTHIQSTIIVVYESADGFATMYNFQSGEQKIILLTLFVV